MVSLGLASSAPVVGLAAQGAAGCELWIGNASPEPAAIAPGGGRLAVLDAGCFATAAQAPDHMDDAAPFDGATTLDAFAIARILLEP